MTRLPRSLLCLLALVVAITACGPSGPASEPSDASEPVAETPTVSDAAASVGELAIHDPDLRLYPSAGALYLRVVDGGSDGDRLSRITVTATGETIELHETLEVDGVMRMEARDEGFEIPAGGELVLEPGGRHGMWLGPAPDDETIELTLTFETAGELVLPIEADRSALGQIVSDEPEEPDEASARHEHHHGGDR